MNTAELYAVYAGPLLRYVWRLTGDRHRGEDIVQETLLRAWLHADRLADDEAMVRSWLFRVAHNVAVDDLRHRRSRPAEVEDTEPAGPHSYADPSDGLLTRLAVHQALATLAPEHRSVLVEVFYRGLSTAEAARLLHIPHGTAKSRLFYGLRKLRATLTAVPG
jgi:RNA polymerase sigma-70 factor (ECF subfamily)